MNPEPPSVPTPPPLPKARAPVPWKWAGGCILLFLLSLALPALRLDSGEVWLGAEVLALGWMGVLIGQYGWAANPLWLVSLVCLLLRHRPATVVLAALAFMVGCTSFSLIGSRIPMDEAGTRHAIVSAFGPAFPVWLAALLAPAFCTFRVNRHRSGSADSG